MAASRDVSSLPLQPSVASLLQTAGFRYVSDLVGLQPTDLSREINCSLDTAVEVLRCATESTGSQNVHPNHASSSSSSRGSSVMTAKALVETAGVRRPIITYSKAMDAVLGGGVVCGQLTEFCGPPGVGKTQICIQLAVDVQMPPLVGGLGGEAVYIDTEGSFMAERAAQVADGLAGRVQRRITAMALRDPSAAALPPFTRDRLLAGIHVFRAHDQTELLAIVAGLSAFVAQRPAVRLVVLDSVAFHFRQDLQDAAQRNRVLSGLSQTLNDVAHDRGVAVVVTNHVTTRIDRPSSDSSGSSSSSGSSGRVVPALGELWSHCVANRVMLSPLEFEVEDRGASTRPGGVQVWNRVCAFVLSKSASRPPGEGRYRLCGDGMRDVSDGGTAMGQGQKRGADEIS